MSDDSLTDLYTDSKVQSEEQNNLKGKPKCLNLWNENQCDQLYGNNLFKKMYIFENPMHSF